MSNPNVIIGFNWSVADDHYEPQKNIPTDSFKDLYDKKWLGSMQRIYRLLSVHLPKEDIDNCVQTNFCFFRSKKENQIKSKYLELSTPLFQQLIDMIQPKRIIGFSSKPGDYFIQNKLCKKVQKATLTSDNGTVVAVKGTTYVRDMEIPICFLPHPNAKFTTVARESAWRCCFEE